MSSPRFISAVFILSLLACSAKDNADTEVEMSDLVGLWNSSETVSGKTDVIYTRISSQGDIVEYDFDGDEVDRGLNCYQINSGSVKHIEKNRFLVTSDLHENKQFAVELALLEDGQAIAVTFSETDGHEAGAVTQTWRREFDVILPYNEPLCDK